MEFNQDHFKTNALTNHDTDSTQITNNNPNIKILLDKEVEENLNRLLNNLTKEVSINLDNLIEDTNFNFNSNSNFSLDENHKLFVKEISKNIIANYYNIRERTKNEILKVNKLYNIYNKITFNFNVYYWYWYLIFSFIEISK